ncbi:MAG: DUF6504 family protein [Planctomycetota bacterium]
MTDFVSESITPWRESFDAAAMGRGEPGLPRGFDWRGGSYEIVERIEQWKHSSREGGRAGGELYLRRHYYRLRMSDGSVWTIYFIRQPPSSGSGKQRWFLYRIDQSAPQ